MSKQQELGVIANGTICYRHAEIHDTSVRFIDRTAILLSNIRLDAVVGGNEVSNPLVYVRQGASWRLGSMSFTRLLGQYTRRSTREPSATRDVVGGGGVVTIVGRRSISQSHTVGRGTVAAFGGSTETRQSFRGSGVARLMPDVEGACSTGGVASGGSDETVTVMLPPRCVREVSRGGKVGVIVVSCGGSDGGGLDGDGLDGVCSAGA